MNDVLTAIALGIVEGLTEFLPISSTGHLMLAAELLGSEAGKWKMFNIVIQLGAILAVVVLYWRTFWDVLMGLFARSAGAWRFLRNILIAFTPSVILGLAFKSVIDQMLEAPMIVAWALVLGGIAIILIERFVTPGPPQTVADMSWRRALGIGMGQCLAMIPGVSRSGATIMGALAMGVDRKTAAEFSFFLAVPTMLGASTLETYGALKDAPGGVPAQAMGVGWDMIAIGFVVSFIVAMAVIKAFVAFVSRSGFTPFGWYRIVAGLAAGIWLTMR